MIRALPWLLLVGCTSGRLDPPAYVILDQDARDRGVALRVGDVEIDSPLPIAVDPADAIVLILDEEVPLDLWAGDVVAVHGFEVVTHGLGEDVSEHAVLVRGDIEVVAQLANEAGAGDLVSTTDGWVMVGPELLAELSTAAIPDGDLEIDVMAPLDPEVEASVADAASLPRDRRSRALWGAGRHAQRAVSPEAPTVAGEGGYGIDLARSDDLLAFGPAGDPLLAALVGVWRSPSGDLVLDASGHFWRESDEAAGEWTVEEGRVVLLPVGGLPEPLDEDWRPLP